MKHYLRGEDGIYYTDLYYLVKHLPPYSLPRSLPSAVDINASLEPNEGSEFNGHPTSPPASPKLQRFTSDTSGLSKRANEASSSDHNLPLPVTSPSKKASFLQPAPHPRNTSHALGGKSLSREKSRTSLGTNAEAYLMPSRMPPQYSFFDLFPFSLLVKLLTKRGKQVKGKKAARMRAKLKQNVVSQNLPLEISLYLVSEAVALISFRWPLILISFLWYRVLMSPPCRKGKWPMFQQQVNLEILIL